VERQLLHTAWLSDATRQAARRLLADVFGADLAPHDWDHCLGGVHTLVWDAGELIGHAAVVQRQLLHAGRTLRTGYVEGLAVRPDRRGEGHGAALMAASEDVIRRAYDLGALSTTEEAAGFYAARGWTLWQGVSSALTPRGVEPTRDEDGGIYVLPLDATLDVRGELTCDWREGDLW
jgi:aminoglycoside 2'-N-acetyltransferase I